MGSKQSQTSASGFTQGGLENWPRRGERGGELQIEGLKTRVVGSCLPLRSLCDNTFVQDLVLICFFKKRK